MHTQAAARFVGDIPYYYDQHLGPVIFEDYAADLARRAHMMRNAHTLEVAAGTGISTEALRAALPASARIVATDLNAPMLEIASDKFEDAPNVSVRQADAMDLPFEDAMFDLVVSQFGVMFFPDRAAFYAEAKRVLKHGGTLLFNVWSHLSDNPFAQTVHASAAKFLPENPPQFCETPYGCADIDTMRADLAKGGFGDVAYEVVRLTKKVTNWTRLAHGAVYGSPLIAEIRAAGAVNPDEVAASIAANLCARFGVAPAAMPLEAVVYTARKA